MRLEIKNEEISSNEKVKLVLDQYEKWYLKDIRTIAELDSKCKYLPDKGVVDAPMSAFILCFTFIDSISGFYLPRENNGCRFRAFVRDFMSDYDPASLWTDLRNPLIHGYTVGENMSYFFRNDGKGHGDPVPVIKDHEEIRKNRTMELSNFVKDVISAFERFKEKAYSDPIRANIVEKFDQEGILHVV